MPTSAPKHSVLLSILLLATVLAPAANADLVKRHNHLHLAHRQQGLSHHPNLSQQQPPEKRLGALLGGLLGGDKPHTTSPAPVPTHSNPPPNNNGGGSGGGSGGGGHSGGGSGGNPTGGSGGDGGNNSGGGGGGGGSGTTPGSGINPDPAPSPSPGTGSGGSSPGGDTPGNSGGDGTDPGNTGTLPGTGTSGTGSNPPPNTTPAADGNNAPSPAGTKDDGAGKSNGTGASGTKPSTGTTSLSGGTGGSSTTDANGDGYPDAGYGSSTSGNAGTDDSPSSSTNKNGNNANGKSGGSSAGKVVVPILITLVVLAIVVGIGSWYWKRVQKRRDAEDRESFSWVGRQGTITADQRRASGESFAGVQRPASQVSFGNTAPHFAEYPAQHEFGNLPQDMIEVNGWPAVSNVHRGSASGSTPSHQEPSSDDAQHIDERPGSGLYPFSNGAHEYNPRSEDGINPAYIYTSYSEHTHTHGHTFSTPPQGNSLEFQYHVHDASTTEEHGQEGVSPFADAHEAAQYAAGVAYAEEEAQPRRSSEAPYSLDPHISQLERLSGTISPVPGMGPSSSRKDSLPPPPSLMAGFGPSGGPSSPTARAAKPRNGSASSRKAVPSVHSNGRLSVASGSSNSREKTNSVVSGYTVATEEVSHEATKSFTIVGRDLLSPTPEDAIPQFSPSSSSASIRESIATITAAGSSTRSPFSVASGSISPSRASSEGNPFASPADNSHNYHAAAAAAATASAAANNNRNTSVSTATTTGYASDDVLSMRMSHFQNVDPFTPNEDGTQVTKAKRAISPSDRRPTVSSMAPSEISARQQ